MTTKKAKHKKLGPPQLGDSNIRRVTFGESQAIKSFLPKPRGVFIRTEHTGTLSFHRKAGRLRGLAALGYKPAFGIIYPGEDTELAEIALREFWGEEAYDDVPNMQQASGAAL